MVGSYSKTTEWLEDLCHHEEKYNEANNKCEETEILNDTIMNTERTQACERVWGTFSARRQITTLHALQLDIFSLPALYCQFS